jgi:hypothetical protein
MNNPKIRRGVAFTLAALGLSGLGLAAAAQLNMAWTGSFQAGATAVNADCQKDTITSVLGSPIFDGTKAVPWSIAALRFTGVSAACNGMKYEAAYKTGAGDWLKFGTGQVSGTTITVIFGPLSAQSLTDVSLTIFS